MQLRRFISQGSRASALTAALVAALAVAACSSSTSSSPSSPATGPASSVVAKPIAKGQLGGACSFGCEPGVACATTEPSCPLGYCAFDGRPDSTPAAYCTADCNDNCPEGYSCESVAHSSARVCLANPGSCGDSELQGQELCDDGNTKDFDACSKDCKLGAPTFVGDVTYGYDRSHAKIGASFPLKGAANGCDKVSVVETNGHLQIDATFCDTKTGERMRIELLAKNEAGVAVLTGSDLVFHYGSVGSTAAETMTASCTNCGVQLTVNEVWGSSTGFDATVSASLSAPSDANHVVIRFAGGIRIVPSDE